MNILCSFNLRCSMNIKVYSELLRTGKHLSLIQPPIKSVYMIQRHCIPLRHYSLDGFYYSLSTSTPVITMQNILVDFHSFSGLPWWSVIILTTLGIRSVFVFPLAVHQNQVIARLANLNAELGKMAPELNREVNVAAKMYGWDEITARKVFKKNMREYYEKFILRDNCHPFKIFLLALFQVPLWMLLSVSLRNLTLNPCIKNLDIQSLQQQLKSEGALWFTDLTLPDMYFIPILLGVVNLVLIEINSLRQIGKSSRLQKTLLHASRLIAVAVAAAATLNPTSVTFYWLCSSTLGLAQNVMLMSPRFRHSLRIPSTANETKTPFKDVGVNFRKRFFP